MFTHPKLMKKKRTKEHKEEREICITDRNVTVFSIFICNVTIIKYSAGKERKKTEDASKMYFCFTSSTQTKRLLMRDEFLSIFQG